MKCFPYPFLFTLKICICLTSSGCGQSSQSTAPSEEELRRIVKEGTSQEELEKRIGPPEILTSFGDGKSMAIYTLRDPDAKAFRKKLTGFQVRYKGGRVEKWSPIYSDRTIFQPATGLQQDPINNALTKTNQGPIFLRVVRETNFSGGIFIDTRELPKVGYVPENPDLSLENLKSVVPGNEIFGPDKKSQNPNLVITLERADAQLLHTFLETNFGNRVLISIGHKHLAAPLVLSSFENGLLSIPFREVETRDDALRDIQTMLPTHQ
jgi:hypothetical protein